MMATQAPFLPVFLASIATYLVALAAGVYLANRRHRLARYLGWAVIVLGSVNLVGFPWVAIF